MPSTTLPFGALGARLELHSEGAEGAKGAVESIYLEPGRGWTATWRQPVKTEGVKTLFKDWRSQN